MIVATEARGLRTGEERPGLLFGSTARRCHRRRQRRYWNSRRRDRRRSLDGNHGSGPGQDLVAGIGQREGHVRGARGQTK
jgi:hypothetical protein